MPSDDEILVDDSDLFESFRQQRMFELRSQIHSRSLDDQVFGSLSEIGHEKELLSLTTSLPRLLIHFYNPAFKSCRILNDHLSVSCEMDGICLSLLFRNWQKSIHGRA